MGMIWKKITFHLMQIVETKWKKIILGMIFNFLGAVIQLPWKYMQTWFWHLAQHFIANFFLCRKLQLMFANETRNCVQQREMRGMLGFVLPHDLMTSRKWPCVKVCLVLKKRLMNLQLMILKISRLFAVIDNLLGKSF